MALLAFCHIRPKKECSRERVFCNIDLIYAANVAIFVYVVHNGPSIAKTTQSGITRVLFFYPVVGTRKVSISSGKCDRN